MDIKVNLRKVGRVRFNAPGLNPGSSRKRVHPFKSDTFLQIFVFIMDMWQSQA